MRLSVTIALLMSAAPVEGGHQYQYGHELQHHAKAHQLVGPRAPEVPAAEQAVDSEGQGGEHGQERCRNQEIEDIAHSLDTKPAGTIPPQPGLRFPESTPK